MAVYDVVAGYGAVGDGVTDDQTAIQNAINAAQTAGGGVVFFPAAKTYLVSGTPQVTGSGIILRGEGDASVILLAPSSKTANGHTIGLWVNGGTNVTIEDLCVDGNFANIAKDGGTVVPSTFGGGTAAVAQTISTAPADGTTETWTVNNAAKTASAAYSAPFVVKIDSEFILVTGGYNTTSWTVKRGFSHGGNGGGATATHTNGTVFASTNGGLFDATITAYGSGTPKTYMSSEYSGGVDVSTYLAYRMPIRISNAENVTVRNCLLKNSASAGVLADSTSVNGCTDILVTGCRIKQTWDNGVYFHQGVQYAEATSNLISDTMYNGVAAVYSDHISVTGNNIRQAGPSFSDSGGVQINGSSNCLMTANLIDAAQFYGLTVNSTQETNITGGQGGNEVYAKNTVISGNQITGCHAADFPTHNAPGVNVFGATDTSITDNIIDNCDYGVSMGSKALNTYIASNKISHCSNLGINVGNSADVINTTIRSNWVAFNGSSGLYGNAPVTCVDNVFEGNVNFGVDLSTPPTGLPRKTDWIIGNIFTDNTDSAIHTGGGTSALAVIERNTFTNSQGVLFTDGSATNGSTTFTSASAAFTSADTGRVLIIIDQGTGGTTTATTIASVTNATTVVLAAAAAATESSLTFLIGRGPGYYTDGSTTTASNSVLTSSTAAFTSQDVGKLVALMSLDATPSILGVTTVNSYTSGTQVALAADFGTISSCAFWINRAQGQSGKAINNYSGYPVIERDNTFYGLPEYQDTGGVHNWVQRDTTRLSRRPLADHDYTVQAADQLVAVTSLTAPRTITLPAGLGSATLPYYLDIKDESGALAAHNVTLSVSGGGTIDGAASAVMATNYELARLYSTGSNWYTTRGNITSADMPAGTTSAQGALQLDGTAADIAFSGNQAAGSTGKAADAGHVHPVATWQAADQGLITQTFDVSLAGSGGAALTSGTMYMARVRIPYATTITNAVCLVQTQNASGLTAAYFGLYNSSGTQVAVTADRHADGAWTAFPAVETAPFTATYSASAGLYWVALLLVFSTTSPGIGRQSVGNGNTVNAGLAAGSGNLRFATYTTTGLSTLPGSFTPSSQMATDNHAWWLALS